MRRSSVLIASTLAVLAIFVNPCSQSVAQTPAYDVVRTQPLVVPPALMQAPAGTPRSIRFVTADDFPPFNFVDGAGLLSGFNVEVARAICAELSIPCTIQVRPFALLADTLSENKADAVVAGLVDTPALQGRLAYSVPYFREPARFVRRWPALVEPSPRSLAGKTVGVVAGSRYDDFLRDFFPAAARRSGDSEAELLRLLKDGEVDAVFTGAVSAAFWLTGPAAGDCCAFSGGAYTEPAYFGDGMKIAVGAGNLALKGAIDGALRSLDADGTLADLALRFFPESLY